jgi:hypothetical protein
MATTATLGKTAKGREEITTRKHNLSAGLRRMLVLIDGRHSKDALLHQFGAIGINEESITFLFDGNFIEMMGNAGAPPAAATPETPEHAQPAAVPDAAGKVVPDEPSIQSIARARYHAVYNFYTQTIKSTLGLRGLTLQLKVERASSVDDLRALRSVYLEAVLKSKGQEMARSLEHRLDELLDAAPASSG